MDGCVNVIVRDDITETVDGNVVAKSGCDSGMVTVPSELLQPNNLRTGLNIDAPTCMGRGESQGSPISSEITNTFWDSTLTNTPAVVSIMSNVILDANSGVFNDSGDLSETKTVAGVIGEKVANIGAYIPEKEGFTFLGWSESPDKGAKASSSILSAAELAALKCEYEDITLYAQWKKNNVNEVSYYYNVYFMGTDGTYSDPVVMTASDFPENTIKLSAFDIPGYRYDAERSNAQGVLDEEGNVSPELNLYYTRNQYKLTFHYEDMSGEQTETYSVRYKSDVPDYETLSGISDPVKIGYIFIGWSQSPDKMIAAPQEMPMADLDLYAVYSPIEITYLFDAGSGEFEDGTQLKSLVFGYGEDPQATVTSLIDEPTAAGKEFIGWDNDVPESATSDLKFTAMFNDIMYSVEFVDEDNNPIDSFPAYYGDEVTLDDAEIPEGYREDCWTVAGQFVDFPYTITGDTVFKAAPDAVRYTVTYEYTGVIPVDAPAVPVDSTEYLPGKTVTVKDIPEVSGYTFVGWTYNGGTFIEGETFVMPEENVTLKGKFKPATYTITFNTAGGSYIAPATYDYGENVVSPANPTREGYEFAGWDPALPSTMPACDMTVMALWNPYIIGEVTKPDTTTTKPHTICTPTDATTTTTIQHSETAVTTTTKYSETTKYPVTTTVSSHTGIEVTTTTKYPETTDSHTEIAGKCGDTLMWTYSPSTKKLTISGSGDMYNFNFEEENEGAPWYEYRKEITSVSFPAGITSIGACAFYGCCNLKNVAIPKAVTSVGDYAFYDSGITKINIPDSVISIGDYAFSHSGITKINIPDSVISIGDEAFAFCDLTEIKLGNGLKTIGNGAFRYIGSYENIIDEIVIPDSVIFIGEHVFHTACIGTLKLGNGIKQININNVAFKSSIKNLIIPDGVMAIVGGDLYYCSIENLYIGSGVEAIDVRFNFSSGLENIYVSEQNPYYKSIDGVMFSKDGKNLVMYPHGNDRTSYIIPDGVTTIKENAFFFIYNFDEDNCFNSVTIPKSVRLIEENAFTAMYEENNYNNFSVYYMGTENEWNSINIDLPNDYLLGATKYFSDGHTHAHTYASKIISSATCTEAGVITYTCECGYSYDETIPAKGHTPGDWIIDIQPSYTGSGSKHKECSVCHTVLETAIIPKVDRDISIRSTSLNYKSSTKIDCELPKGYTAKFKSSDESVLVIDENGIVTAKGAGTATITVTVISPNGYPATNESGEEITESFVVTVGFAWWQWIIYILLFGFLWY